MKEEIKNFFNEIPEMYLPDIFDALADSCYDRGIDYMSVILSDWQIREWYENSIPKEDE